MTAGRKLFSARVTAEVDPALDGLRAASARALGEIGARALSEAKARCPVDTGALRRSLTWRVAGRALEVGSPLPYAARVEREQPFLGPALAKDALRRAVEREMRGI